MERLQSFLGQPTSEGVAYRIDTRLRPEGTKGPLAIPLAGLQRYFRDRAEPWERLAWTRSQVLVGSPNLSKSIMKAVESFVYGPWDDGIPDDMHRIRMRMERELAENGGPKLDFKVGRGGLADIDFVVELVQIREGGTQLEFRLPGTRRLLTARPSTRYITSSEYEQLRESYQFLRTVEMLARMDLDIATNAIRTDGAALAPIGKRLGFVHPSGDRLLSSYREVTEGIRSTYTAVLARL